MKKKLVALLAAALLTVSFAGTALAAFVPGDLVRVVYDTVGSKEYATDLGSWATLQNTAAGANLVVGGGVDAVTLANTGAAAWGNLVVGYYFVDPTAGALKVGVAADGVNPITSGARKWNGIAGGANSIQGNYIANAIPGTNSAVIADKAVTTNTFFNIFDNKGISTGYYAGWEVANAVNPGGSLSLAALTTTGYVEQTMVAFNVAALLNVPTLGVNSITVRTMADGSTLINPGAVVAPVPVPPAFFLMGSGLLGMFGIRRKMNA
jgi:hypothetical protein